jgi:S1/P1 Nuclease
MSRFAPGRTRSWRGCLLAAAVFSLLWPCRTGFGWGREGHRIVALIAEHYMTGEALTKASNLLAGNTIDSRASWADDYRRDHPETGRWHYIDIPLADSKIDLSRECPDGDCVIVKTEQFVAVLRDPKAERTAKTEALKYVVHFVGDLHQPLHDEDDNDEGGNMRHAIFDGRPDNLHWIWDTGLLEHINRSPEALAVELESRITRQDREKWVRGSIEDWALEGRLARAVAYEDLPDTNPAPITPAYERQADPAIELQLEKAGVRLAYVLDHALQ